MIRSAEPVLHEWSLVPVLLSLIVRASGVTLGRHIFVRRGVQPTDRLLRHEAVHVAQYAELGVLGFWAVYLRDFLRAWWALRDGEQAYREIRLEQEARLLQGADVPWREVGRLRSPGGWRTLPRGGDR